MTERRENTRRRVCLGGQVETAAFMLDTPCMVRDVSLTGARLRVSPAAILPERVVLHVPVRGERRAARLVWREGDMAGLLFEDDAATGARPAAAEPHGPSFPPGVKGTLH